MITKEYTWLRSDACETCLQNRVGLNNRADVIPYDVCPGGCLARPRDYPDRLARSYELVGDQLLEEAAVRFSEDAFRVWMDRVGRTYEDEGQVCDAGPAGVLNNFK